MIADLLSKTHLYAGLHRNFKKAFQYLERFDTGSFITGTHEIDGQDIYAIIQEYNPKTPSEGFLEAHRKYIDIQYIVSGEELIGYAPRQHLQESPYIDNKDFMKLSGDYDLIHAKEGMFFIFFPDDAHMPGLQTGGRNELVRKIVVKVRV
jgi:biofilm protein TabA